MLSRRTLLKLGAAGAASAALRPAAGSRLLRSPPAIARAVYDERHSEAREFGAALAALGIATSGIRGDVSGLWYRDLKTQLSRDPLPLVGLTDRAALFCLEELARDLGLRVCGRIDHVGDGTCSIVHQAAGSAAWVNAGRRLEGGPGFGRVMAAMLGDPPQGRSRIAQKVTGPFSRADRTTLVSWWIA
jgi:hypothetical protein